MKNEKKRKKKKRKIRALCEMGTLSTLLMRWSDLNVFGPIDSESEAAA